MDGKDPNSFKVTTLKEVLREMNLQTNGKKVELVSRLMAADPEGRWIENASAKEGDEEEDSDITRREFEVLEREASIARREAALLERELQAAREEVERMRLMNMNAVDRNEGSDISTRNSVRQLSLNNIFNLLSDFDGNHEMFNTWESQIRLLKDTYTMSEEETKVMISGKVKGKTQRWFHSNSNNLNLTVEALLKEMKKMYGRETDCLMRRKKFEDRNWKRDETFADYYHEKTILANQVPINANEMVSYLIRGIPNENLRNQVRLQKFMTDAKLLEAMEDISLPAPFKPEMRKEGRSHHNAGRKDEGTTQHRAYKHGAAEQKNVTRCYNCGEAGHIATRCAKPKREKGACYMCGKMGHQVKECPENERKDKKPDEQILNVERKAQEGDEFRRKIKYEVDQNDFGIAFELFLETQLDSGSPISFIKESLIPKFIIEKIENNSLMFTGINESALKIIGMVRMKITIGTIKKNNVIMYVVPDKTMLCQVVLGRDLMREFEFKLLEPEAAIALNNVISEIMNIEVSSSNAVNKVSDSLAIGFDVPDDSKIAFKNLFEKKYLMPERPQEPVVKMKLTLNLREHTPFHFGPRRLSFSEKKQLQEIIDKLLAKGIIRASESEYASPVVMVRKKNGVLCER